METTLNNTTVISKEDFLRFTKNRKMIAKADKYALKVRSVNEYLHPTNGLIAIINFDAVTPYHVKQIKEHLSVDDFQSASNTVFTGSVRVGKDYVPTKGEIVNVEVVDGATKDGEAALFCGGVTPRPVAEATSVDFASMFE
jgi:hypothetical protein